MSLNKPVAPLRIFLSYGHDRKEELVRRIKADLETRGHEVWIDKSDIQFGDDWRRSITDGIVDSHRVWSFVSNHSTRDPGVCRNEIAIGVKSGNIRTILVEREEDVKPPVHIDHIVWLDIHDRKEQTAVMQYPDSTRWRVRTRWRKIVLDSKWFSDTEIVHARINLHSR